MNRFKIPAIIFTAISFGAIQETFRVFTSPDADIAANRAGLIPLSIILTLLFIFLAAWLWIRSSKNNL